MKDDADIVAGELRHLQRGLERHRSKRPRQAGERDGAGDRALGLGGRAQSVTNPPEN